MNEQFSETVTKVVHYKKTCKLCSYDHNKYNTLLSN